MSERPETQTLLDLHFWPPFRSFITSSWTKLVTPILFVLLIIFDGVPWRSFLILVTLILMGIMWLFGKLKPGTQENSGQSSSSRAPMSPVGHHQVQGKLGALKINEHSRMRNVEEHFASDDGSSTTDFRHYQRSFNKEPLDTSTWSSVTSPGFTSRVVRMSTSTPLRDFNTQQIINQSPFDLSPHRHLGLGEVPYPSWRKTPKHESPLVITHRSPQPSPFPFLSPRRKFRSGDEFTAYLKIAPVTPTSQPPSPQHSHSGFNFSGSEGNKSVGLGGIPQAALGRGFSPRLMSSHNFAEKQIKVPTSQTSTTPNNIIDALNNRKRTRGSEASSSSSNAIARNVLSSPGEESPKSSKRTKFYPTISHHEDREMSNRSISNMPIQSSSHTEEPMSSESILEQMNQTEKRFLPDDDEAQITTRTSKRSKGTSGASIATKTTTTINNSYRKRRNQNIGVVEQEPRERPSRVCSCNECYAEAAGISLLDMSSSPAPSQMDVSSPRVPSPILKKSNNHVSYSDKSIETEKGAPDRLDNLLTNTRVIDAKAYFEDKERRLRRLNRLLGLSKKKDQEMAASTESSSSQNSPLNHKGIDMVDGAKNGFTLNQPSSSNGINFSSPLTTNSGGFSFGLKGSEATTSTSAASLSLVSSDSTTGASKGGFSFGITPVSAGEGSALTSKPFENSNVEASKESGAPPPPYSAPSSSQPPPVMSTPSLTQTPAEGPKGFSFGAPNPVKDNASSSTTTISSPAINLPAFGFAAAASTAPASTSAAAPITGPTGPSSSSNPTSSTFTFGASISKPTNSGNTQADPAATTTTITTVLSSPFTSTLPSATTTIGNAFNPALASSAPQPLFTHTALTTTTSVFSQPITSSSVAASVKTTEVSIPNLFGTTPLVSSVAPGLSTTSSITNSPGGLTSSIFGASTATPATTTTEAPAPPPAFSFGQAKSSSTPTPFGGGTSSAVPIFGSTSSSGASGGFAFGGSAPAPAPSTTTASQGFAFGDAGKDKAPGSSVGGFSFVGAAGGAAKSEPSTGGFSFGGASSAGTGIVSQPAAASPFTAFSTPAGSNPTPGFGFGSGSHASASTGGVFGTPTTTPSGGAGSGFSFGKKETPNQGGMFGAATTTSGFTSQNTMSGFGGSTAASTTPAFGQAASPFSQGAQAQPSPSVFGQSMSSGTPIFGSSQPAASPFGGSSTSFGGSKPLTATPSAFGQPVGGNTGFGQSAFSASTPTMGQQSTPNVFGQSSSASTAFGSAPASTPAPVFNFGGASSTPASAFGTPTGTFNFAGAAAQQPATPASPFNFAASANQTPSAGFPFGQQSSSAGFNFTAQATQQGFPQPGQSPQPPQMFNLGSANTTPSFGRRRETRARRFR